MQRTLLNAFTWESQEERNQKQEMETQKAMLWFEQVVTQYDTKERLAKVYGIGRRRTPNEAIKRANTIRSYAKNTH